MVLPSDAFSNCNYQYFKYRPIDKYLIDSLVHPSLWFSKLDALNDPFDCQVDMEKAWRRAMLSATGSRKKLLESLEHPTFSRNWKTMLEKVGICSFSLTLNESLLWSHYADEHRGVCLLYSFPEALLNDGEIFLGVDKVTYDSDTALTDWMKCDESIDVIGFIQELVKRYLTTKSSPWAYEQETRIIKQEYGLFEIPSHCLAQVCFGLRTPEADIELVKKLASDYSGCSKFCKIERDTDRDFGVIAKEI